MAKILKYPFAILLLSAYMLTSTGFGIHRCSHEDSIEVLIVKSDRGCEEIHSHCGCGSDGCSSGKHDKNCCDTEIIHLDFVSRTAEESSKFSSEYVKLSFVPVQELINDGYVQSDYTPRPDYIYEWAVIHKKTSNSYLAQWRL